MSRLKQDYGYVHRPTICDPTISVTAKAVYAVLAAHSDVTGMCYVGRPRIATSLGVSRATVSRALAELVKANVVRRIDRTRDGRQISSMTVLIEESRGITDETPGGLTDETHNKNTKNKTRSPGVHVRSAR